MRFGRSSNPEGINPTDGKPDQAYENYHSAERFVELADAILNGPDVQTTEIPAHRRTTEWQNRDGDRFVLIKEERQVSSHIVAGRKRPLQNYWLSKYSAYAPSKEAVKRYALTQDGHMIHPVLMADGTGSFYNTQSSNKQAALESLAILSAREPAEAKRILQSKFDEDFKKMVGGYILSDLAVVEKVDQASVPIDEETAIEAAVNHVKRIMAIEKAEERKSKLVTNKLDTHKHAAVEDAIESKPAHGRRNSKYIDTHLVSAAKDMALGMKKGWKNRIIERKRRRPA